MIIDITKFPTRHNLESHVKALQVEGETDLEIKGTEEDLRRLQLDDTCTVFGVKCTSSDFKTKDYSYVVKKVERGVRIDFGINTRNRKIR